MHWMDPDSPQTSDPIRWFASNLSFYSQWTGMTKQRKEAKTSLAPLRLSRPRYSKFIKGRLEKEGFNLLTSPGDRGSQECFSTLHTGIDLIVNRLLAKKEESRPPFDKSKLSFLQFATRTIILFLTGSWAYMKSIESIGTTLDGMTLSHWQACFDLRQKRSHTKKGSFMQCITGGPPMDSSNSMNEGRKAGFLYEDSNKKKKGQTISYWMRKSSFCGFTLPPSEMREPSIGGSQSMKILPFLTCNSPLSVSIQYLSKWTFL